MKVNLNVMTDRERIVLTKEQLLKYADSCDINISGIVRDGAYIDVHWPPVIEVKEVIGE